jgi:glycosyltransferase involved in cell wall biosynthesis/peptidoglycan/xylan/chitin deacetylase (PgdA/CDA1 family)
MPVQNVWSRLPKIYRRRVAGLLFRRPLMIHPDRPMISFSFDDFPKSALAVGGEVLRHSGLTGTYYTALGLLGGQTPTGRMFDAADVAAVLERGHELGCHTFSHCDSWDTRTATFEKSIIDNREALSRLVPGAEFRSFAYPISLPRPLTKAKVADYFLCCRGAGQTFNAGRTDLNQLSAYFLEKSRNNIQAVKDLIDHNRKAHGWLIFATHDISNDPTPYGCTPEFFEQVVAYAVASGARILPVARALGVLGAPSRRRRSIPVRTVEAVNRSVAPVSPAKSLVSKPLVSILIPAFNAQQWIADTLRSAIAQTWEHKEIIVVDDGSADSTVAIAKQFEPLGVRVVSQKNQGAAAARNKAYSLSQGDYIQWLDADDLLAPDKISRQMAAAERCGSKRTLLSSPFGRFQYRWHRAAFSPSALWNDLSPLEWLLHKMGDNLYMQTATWLVSRELSEEAGPWDTRMLSDDDGEYFCRVLLRSNGVRFVPETTVYYRGPGYENLAYIGTSRRKCEALWLSMQLHIGYLRSLRDDDEARMACRTYMQRNLIHFYPEISEIVEEMRATARSLGGELVEPHLSSKYSLVKKLLGWQAAKGVAISMRKMRWSSVKTLDQVLFRLQKGPSLEMEQELKVSDRRVTPVESRPS